MIARIRVVVDVPFDFDVVPIDLDPNVNNDPEVYASRESAAEHAISTVLPSTAFLVEPVGDVYESMVEEVREA